MTIIRFGKSALKLNKLCQVACLLLGLAIVLASVAPPAIAQYPTRLFDQSDQGTQPSKVSRCTGEGVEPLAAESQPFPAAPCSHLPDHLPPSTGPALSSQSGSGSHSTKVSPFVTNKKGDIVELKTLKPTQLYKDSTGFYGFCEGKVPYVGSIYDPCAEIYLYDAKRKSSTEVPTTNSEEDAEYDACGTKVGSETTYNWHNTGAEYLSSGLVGGLYEEVPVTEPESCLGTWRLRYAFTETFSDKETLTDVIEVPFTVTAVPIKPSETAGGGNPAELSCSQLCAGDPVNTATGEYFESTTDLAIPGRGPALQMTRTYGSGGGIESSLGRGWTFSYAMSLKANAKRGTATITNPNGSQVAFEPGSKGYVAPPRILATLTHNEDGTWTYVVKARTIYTFNSAGKLTKISDLNGDAITLTYNGSGRVESATDGAGHSLWFGYEGEGPLVQVRDSSERMVKYAYDSHGRLAEVTNVRGGHERFTYTEEGRLKTREDARGHVVLTNAYDFSGRLESQTDGLEHKTTYAYEEGEGGAEVTDITDPRGYVTEYEYKGEALAKRTEAKGTASSATWIYERDPNTEGITAVTDPNGHTSHATYDARGNQTSTEDPLGHTTKSVYDSLDGLTEYTDANGVTTTYEYDKRGNLLKASTPLLGSEPAQTRTISYAHEDEAHPGDVTAITDPRGKATHFKYDAAGDLTSVTDPAGDETTYTYDELGRRLTRVSPRGNVEGANPAEYTTTYTYDPAGNRLSATDPLGHERKWSYDADGDLETETDGNGHTTTYTYDAANQQTRVEKPNGNTTETAYDPDGNVSSQTNGLKHATTYSYGPLDQLLSRTDPLERTTSYVYDGVGNLKSVKDPEGRTASFSYNAGNELTETSYSDGVTPTVKYGYDKDGRRTSMIDGTGETTSKYDSLGRLTSTTDGHGDKTSYGYDLAGNETEITYPNGKTLTRSFDEAGRLSGITDWLGNTTRFSYNPDSNPTAVTFPEATANVDEFAYNQADEMSAITIKHGAETLASLGYSRDKVGQVEGLAAKGLPGSEAEVFGYDENNRLTKAGEASYEYDAADNLTKAPGTTNAYDAADQLESGTGATYGYDKEGDRVEAVPSSGPRIKYRYDQARNLISVERAGEGEIPAIEESYAYDGAGLRASETVSGTTRHLTWDSSSGLPLLLSDERNSYIYGPDGLPIEQVSPGGVATFYHHDQLGSTRLLTNSSGEVTATFSYDAYGKQNGRTGTQTTPFGFAGQYTDEQSGLQYLRARTYDPATGQFLSRDPLQALTRQPYLYASDNPLNSVDPSGLCDAEFWTGSFWTEGNCLSESPLNPIPYYQREIERIEAGCSYWDSVSEGIKGAFVATADVAGAAEGGGLLTDATAEEASAGDVVFGHGARHLVGTGLDQAEVESAIQSQIEQQIGGADSTGSFWGTVEVNGQTILYKAYTLPDGTINVGTYYVVS